MCLTAVSPFDPTLLLDAALSVQVILPLGAAVDRDPGPVWGTHSMRSRCTGSFPSLPASPLSAYPDALRGPPVGSKVEGEQESPERS